MPIQLFRVDERLIHGQVVIGWGSHLRPVRYVVVDDAVAASDWEQNLYALGLPEGIDAEFISTEAASPRMDELKSDPASTIVLCRDVATALALAQAGGLDGVPVNLGGLHHGPGRKPVLSYVYLDATDADRLRELELLGVVVTAQDLPGSRAVDLDHLLS